MGLKNFTGKDDTGDDDTNNGGGGGGIATISPSGTAPSGDSPTLEMLVNMNEEFKNATPAKYRDGVIAQTIAVLIGKTKPNPLLVGGAGVGKTQLVEEIARRIANSDPSIPKRLQKSTIYNLQLSNLVAGAGIVGQLETRVSELVDFLTDPENDAIVFIDEIHQLTKSSGGHESDPIMGKVSQILKPALSRGKLRVIGATTTQESRGMDHDPALKRRFTRLIVDELSREQTYEVLLELRTDYTTHYHTHVLVSDEVLRKIVNIADELGPTGSHRPDNAITLMDRAMGTAEVRMSQTKAKAAQAGISGLAQLHQLTEDDVKTTALQMATGLPVKPHPDFARARTALGRLRGQGAIADQLIDQMTLEDLGLFPRVRPTSWMFAGASGVGKTEATKIFAQELTGAAPIIINMAEYSEKYTVSKLIGAPPGYIGSDSNKELVFDELAQNPYRVLLLDELEKAHREVQQLFLSILDEGKIRMASGNEIDVSKAIIIATTNAGREALRSNNVGFQLNDKPASLNREQITRALAEYFPLELLGRFSNLIVFNEIDVTLYEQIVEDEFHREASRIVEEHARLAAFLPGDHSALLEKARETFAPKLGARPARDLVKNWIQNVILHARTAYPLGIPTGTAYTEMFEPVSQSTEPGSAALTSDADATAEDADTSDEIDIDEQVASVEDAGDTQNA